MDTAAQRKIKIGACAWSYDDWRDVFYPPHLPQNLWLEFYARHLSAVEIDSTFYHAPGAKAVAHWMEQTPAHFTFSCKMPRQITHELRLRDCDEPLDAFLESLAPLRPRLGCVLIQLPPGFSPEAGEKDLKRFLARLPGDFRYAVEFRHPGWHLPRIVERLAESGICWAWTDTSPLREQNRGAFEPLPQTAKFLYIRLMGDLGTRYHSDGSRVHRYAGLQWPRDSSLENWSIKIQKHLAEAGDVFLNCSNHFEGFAPLTCRRIGRLLGIPIELPPAPTETPPQKHMKLL